MGVLWALVVVVRTLVRNALDIAWALRPWHSVRSPFLEGNYAPVHVESTVSELQVIGKVPEDLRGAFVRNGPNPQHHPIVDYHWFDGDGMLHGVYFGEGGVRYLNRYVQTGRWQFERKKGRSYFYGIGSLNNFLRLLFWTLVGLVRRVTPMSAGKLFKGGTANTAVEYHAGRFLALVESSLPTQVDARDLRTVGEYDFAGRLQHPFTAHPKVDPFTGEMMFFGYELLKKPYLSYSVADKSGALVRTVPITLPRPVMMHDFAITANYSIFMDLPLEFDKKRLARHEWVFTFVDRPSRFGIAPRAMTNESEIRWFDASPCFIFHTANAVEVDNEVVLYACRSARTTVLQTSMRSGESDADPRNDPFLYEFRFNMKTGACVERQLLDKMCEFPRIHPRLLGRPFRYIYVAGFVRCEHVTAGSVIKYDTRTHTSVTYELGAGRSGGEFVFVPRKDGASEDDGYLMTFVFDESRQASEIIILDAQKLASAPVLARILLPVRVPYGFHGKYLTEKEINEQVFASAGAAAAAST